jgi:hypothetical protein
MIPGACLRALNRVVVAEFGAAPNSERSGSWRL